MQSYGKSDIGKSRTDNQDAFVIRKMPVGDCSLFVVCDGVGGAAGGAVASTLTCDTFADSVSARFEQLLSPQDDFRLSESMARSILVDSLNDARGAVCRKAKSDPALESMSTTIVALLLTKTVAYLLNVGDSRAYIYSAGSITRLTRDHSYLQSLVDSGVLTPEQTAASSYRNVITRSVGLLTDSTPDLYKISLSELSGYQILLCSDGLTSMVEDEQLEKQLTQTGSVRSKVERLIQLANRGGGYDNITVILISEKG